MQSLAALDAVLAPEPHDRLFAFDASWREGEMLGTYYSGSGDHWAAAFRAAGVVLVGLTHETPAFTAGESPPWVFERVPHALSQGLLDDESFDSEDANICIWHAQGETGWRTGSPPEIDDGAAWLLAPLLDGWEGYVRLALDYYGAALDPLLVRRIFEHQPLTRELTRALSGAAPHAGLETQLMRIAYPVAG